MFEEYLLSQFIAFLCFFIYNLLAFKFAKKMIVTANEKAYKYIACSFFNSLAFLLYSVSEINNDFFFVAMLLSLIIFEFHIVCRAELLQAVFGASFFTMHIYSIRVVVITIISKLYNISPYEVLSTDILRARSDIWLIVILTIVLIVMPYIIPTKDIQRISTAKTYSLHLTILAIMFTFFSLLTSYFLLTDQNYPEQLYIVLANFMLTLALFYFAFIYVISFVNMFMYKRQSDQIESEYYKMLEQKRKVLKQTQIDKLTGLFNKKFIYSVLDELYNSRELGFGIFFIDVNGLKYVNDTYGHESGDKLILCVANTTKNTVRDYDVVARVGGDEILVVLANVEKEHMPSISSRLLNNIDKNGKEENFPVSISLGQAYLPPDNRDITLNELLDIADKDMLANKKSFYEKGGAENCLV